MKKKPKWTDALFSKKTFGRAVVVYCITFISAYTIASYISFVFTGLEASTLTTCVYGFFGGELLFLCVKRILARPSTVDGQEPDTVDDINTSNESVDG